MCTGMGCLGGWSKGHWNIWEQAEFTPKGAFQVGHGHPLCLPIAAVIIMDSIPSTSCMLLLFYFGAWCAVGRSQGTCVVCVVGSR